MIAIWNLTRKNVWLERTEVRKPATSTEKRSGTSQKERSGLIANPIAVLSRKNFACPVRYEFSCIFSRVCGYVHENVRNFQNAELQASVQKASILNKLHSNTATALSTLTRGTKEQKQSAVSEKHCTVSSENRWNQQEAATSQNQEAITLIAANVSVQGVEIHMSKCSLNLYINNSYQTTKQTKKKINELKLTCWKNRTNPNEGVSVYVHIAVPIKSFQMLNQIWADLTKASSSPKLMLRSVTLIILNCMAFISTWIMYTN